MTTIEQIISIANQLANQGKKPTIALIKTQLTSPAPLPVIIATLKNWRHEPNNTPPLQPTADQQSSNENQHITLMIEQAVKQAITPLQQEIDDIKAILKKLTK